MSDTYVECLVAKKSGGSAVAIKALAYGFTAFFVIAGLMFNVILLIPAVVLAIICFVFVPTLDLEYEYLYLDKEITIDKIISKQKRKRANVIDLNKVEIIAPEKSHEMDSYKNRNLKVLDYSSKDENDKIYLMHYRDEKAGECLVRFNPNEEMLAAIKTVFPRKVYNY